MKKLLMVLLLTLLVSLSCSAADFMDLSWGDPPEKLGDYKLTNTLYPFERALFKVEEVPALGSIPVYSINYFFFEDKLVGVKVITLAQEETLDMLKAKYGDPTSFSSPICKLDQLTVGLLGGSHYWVTPSSYISFSYVLILPEEPAKPKSIFSQFIPKEEKPKPKPINCSWFSLVDKAFIEALIAEKDANVNRLEQERKNQAEINASSF